jgi:DNA repair exonuclease SbcCD nuclease subunit
MRILVICDTHWGVRSDNALFYNYQKKFIDNVFFRYIDAYKPDAIFHLGDLVDNRRVVNYKTYDTLQNDFLNPMADLDIPQHWLVGNHDAFYKNTLRINAMSKFVAKGDVYDRPKEIMVGDCKILMLPWICDENREESLHFIKNSNARYCFGHLEVDGFEVKRGTLHHGGIDRRDFNNFDSVFSGHFHNRSSGNNIRYLGAAFQFDWSDYNEWKGISILDTDTGHVNYLRNPYTMFNVIEYNENSEEDYSKYKDTYVRLMVKEKNSENKYNDFVSKLSDQGINNLTIIDNTFKKIELTNQEIVVDELESIFYGHIDQLDISNKKDVIQLFDNIYKEIRA